MTKFFTARRLAPVYDAWTMNTSSLQMTGLENLFGKQILPDEFKNMASHFVDGTEEGTRVLFKVYPKHIYDTLRRKIAVEFAGKEIAKILDADDKWLLKLQHIVDDLYSGQSGVYAPVHDFWSFIEMILHVKKKELPELISAENITWNIEDILIEELSITWMPFLEQRQEIFGPKPWKVKDLIRIFSTDHKLFDQAQSKQREAVGDKQHNFDQTNEPIVVVHRNNKLDLIDGNGRLFNALLDNQRTISCYIGKLQGRVPINYWVSAGSIKQFCLEILSYKGLDNDAFNSGLSYLRTKLSNNKIALINYELFLRADFPELDEGLRGVVT